MVIGSLLQQILLGVCRVLQTFLARRDLFVDSSLSRGDSSRVIAPSVAKRSLAGLALGVKRLGSRFDSIVDRINLLANAVLDRLGR